MENNNDNKNTNFEENKTVNNQTTSDQVNDSNKTEQVNQNTSNQTNQNINNSSTNSEIESGKVLAILSYLGILVLIPYLTEKNNSFVVFHAKQGLNLFILEIIGFFAAYFIGSFVLVGGFLITIIEIGVVILSIIGIVYAAQGEQKELPVVSSIKIIK